MPMPKALPLRIRPGALTAILSGLFLPWAAYFASLHFDTTLRKMDDGAQYLLIAKSLAHGMGFSNMAMPGVPDFLNIPSAFPLLLVPYWWFPSPPELAYHLIMAGSMCLGAWLSFLWSARFLPRGQAFLVALAFASSPLFVVHASTLLTEAPYVLLVYAGLWFGARDSERAGKGPEGWLALLCWLILFRLRINTMAFLAIHLLVLMRRGERAKGLTGTVAAAAWLAFEWSRKAQEGGGYLQYDLGSRFALDAGPLEVAATLWRAALANLYSFFGSAFGQLMLPTFYDLRPMDPLKRLAVLGLSAWGLWGLVLFWKRFPAFRPYLLAFIFSWAPFFLQRSVAFTRYMFPSFPVLAACLALPFLSLSSFLPGRSGRVLPALATTFLLVVMANQALHSLRSHRFAAVVEENLAIQYLHGFIRDAHPPPDVVLSHRHYHAHLETGRPALAYPGQWEYARSRGMFTGRERIWILLPSPPAKSRLWDMGDGWSLEETPLAARGDFSLYEIRSGIRSGMRSSGRRAPAAD